MKKLYTSVIGLFCLLAFGGFYASGQTIFEQFSNSGVSFEGLYANPTNGYAIHGDFNEDGHEDLLIMGPNYNDFNTSFITILQNDGLGGFIRVNIVADGLCNGSIAVSRVGYREFLIAYQGGTAYPPSTSNAKAVVARIKYANDTRVRYTKLQELDYPLYNGDIQFIDINNDGQPDIIQQGGASKVYAYLNDGNYGFDLATDVSGLRGVVNGKSKVYDVNNDGLLDLVSIDERYRLFVYINNGDKTFTAQSIASDYSFKSSPAFELGDFNEDGNIDIVAFDYSSLTNTYSVAFFYSDDEGVFTQAAVNNHMGVADAAVAVSDLNNDGHLDVLYAGTNNKESKTDASGSTTKKAYVLWGDGTGSFTQHVKATPSGYSPDMSCLAPLAEGQYIAADFNGDGKDDIFALGHIGKDFPGKIPRKADLYVSSSIDWGEPVEPMVTKVWEEYDYQNVRLLDGRVKEAQDKEIAYLKTLDIHRLFANTLKYNKGITGYENYGGWEAGGYGCSFAHYMSAISFAYSATGDEELLEKVNQCIDIMIDCQAVMGDGFFSFADGTTWCFDRTAKEKTIVLGGWDENGHPWDVNGGGIYLYGHHKTYAGLRDAYLCTGREDARIAYLRYNDWLLMWMQNFDDANFQKILEAEHGGFVETLTDAYAMSGKQKYLDGAVRFTRNNFASTMSAGIDDLAGRHSNFHVPMALGSYVHYMYSNDNRSHLTGKNFFDIVLDHHTLVTGGNGNNERFATPDHHTHHLGTRSTESCSSYNMLKLAKRIFTVEDGAEYMDYYERTLYNHIMTTLSTHDDAGVTYYTGLWPGQFKMYDDLYNGFWCCVGTGMESHSKYVDAIYFHNEEGVLVNLFIPSTLNDPSTGMQLSMETTFPMEDEIRVTITDAGSFNGKLMFRYPQWAEKGSVKVTVNGGSKAINGQPGEIVSVTHSWSDGDVVAITIPCKLRLEDIPDDINVSALFFGPVLLAGDLGPVGQNDVGVSAPAEEIINPEPFKYFPSLIEDRDSLDNWIKRKEDAFEFITEGLETNYTFKPFYDTHHRRYSVYWKIANEEQLEKEKEIIPDRVITGESVSEETHNVDAVNSVTGWGVFNFWGNSYHSFRNASATGYVSYDFNLLDPVQYPDQQYYLEVTYFGSEPDGYGNFSMYADNTVFATQGSIAYLAPLDFAVRYYPISTELTNGKSSINIRFQGGLLSLYGLKITTTDDVVKRKKELDTPTGFDSPMALVNGLGINVWYAKNEVIIQDAEGFNLKIIDMNGRVLQHDTILRPDQRIPVNLKKGVYVAFCEKDKKAEAMKFIVD